MKSDDKNRIEDKGNALMAASQKLGEKMYADQQAKEAAAGGAGPEAASQDHAAHAQSSAKANDDNVVDAEVKEVKKG